VGKFKYKCVFCVWGEVKKTTMAPMIFFLKKNLSEVTSEITKIVIDISGVDVSLICRY